MENLWSLVFLNGAYRELILFLKQRYDTIELAAHDVKLSGTSISKCIRGERRSSGGFLWRKELKKNLPKKIAIENSSIESNQKKESLPIPIIQLTIEGESVATYESIRKACISTKIDSKGIRDVLNGRQKTAGGFSWKKQK